VGHISLRDRFEADEEAWGSFSDRAQQLKPQSHGDRYGAAETAPFQSAPHYFLNFGSSAKPQDIESGGIPS
jgi:hypothetical protein